MFHSCYPIESMAAAVYRALADPNILPDVEYEHRALNDMKNNTYGTMRKRRPCVEEITAIQFHQVWGSTALGFGGMGGAAMTGAYTTVIIMDHNKVGAVFFAGTHAYTIIGYNEKFNSDMMQQKMAPVSGKSKYS